MLPVGGVDPLLESAHLALDNLLDLVGQLGLDVLLESTKEERSKHLMKTTNDEKLLLLVDTHLVGSSRVGERCVEPLIEGLDGVEDLGKDEVEEGPQLGKVVLRDETRSKRRVSFQAFDGEN